MIENNKVDIKENYILKLDDELLTLLLKDRSSGKNLIWATDIYASKGQSFFAYSQMSIQAVSGKYGNVIKPRIEKSKKEQQMRIRDKAEVFTPSWICNSQNNLIDEAWFGRKNVFNKELDKSWKTVKSKIKIPDNKTWQEYVQANRMEISCGEAPYLVSRYDTVTGEVIDVKNRIGLLDRKLRIVDENTEKEEDWYKWAIEAFKSIYGYDWQGDNVLIARENLLFTFSDYYYARFKVAPIKEYLLEIADILTWNIWQMDGLKFVIPNSCKPIPKLQMSIFDSEETDVVCPGCLKNNHNKHIGTYCKIKNWGTKRAVKFISLFGRKK